MHFCWAVAKPIVNLPKLINHRFLMLPDVQIWQLTFELILTINQGFYVSLGGFTVDTPYADFFPGGIMTS